jgi:hypothetical protein
MSPGIETPVTGKRTVCDHCRRRRKFHSISSVPVIVQQAGTLTIVEEFDVMEIFRAIRVLMPP